MSASFQCSGVKRHPAITMGFVASPDLLAVTAIEGEWRDQLTATGRQFEDANMSPAWTLLSTKAVFYDGTHLTSHEDITPVIGTHSSLPTPAPNTSIIVAKVTGISGRKYRGRMFTPPTSIDEGNIDQAGIINSTQLASHQAWWNGFFGQMTAFGVECALLHADAAGGGHTILTGLSVTPLVGTNRRRLR